MTCRLKGFFTCIFFPEKKLYAAKNQLRQIVKTAKKELNEANKQAEAIAVFEKIEQTPEFQQAKVILMYWSMSDELPTHNFVKKWSHHKTVLLPIVTQGKLIFRQFEGEEQLQTGQLHLKEPSMGEDYQGKIDIAIIPGVAFDKHKNRLGRGKAYYDSYLSSRDIPHKWAVGFDLQLVKQVPTTKNDIKMDRIFTASNSVW